MDISVLLIAFNRPDCAQAVFDVIKRIKPAKFYLAVDGSRKNVVGEEFLTQQCRDIVKQVDWDCEVHTLFREYNVGCGLGPSEAISWAFSTTDKLIILEDDCLPSLSFFTFCHNLLDKYEHDRRVWIISGLSIHPCTKFFGEYDYLFSHYAHTWGWATWKDRWAEFDICMKDVPEFLDYNGPENILYSRSAAKRLRKKLLSTYQNIDKEITHSWDTQWDYVRLKNNSCDIVPKKNLIKNVGNSNGTHVSQGGLGSNLALSDFTDEINHPPFVICNRPYDKFHYKVHIHPSFVRLLMGAIISPAKMRFLLSLFLRRVKAKLLC